MNSFGSVHAQDKYNVLLSYFNKQLKNKASKENFSALDSRNQQMKKNKTLLDPNLNTRKTLKNPVINNMKFYGINSNDDKLENGTEKRKLLFPFVFRNNNYFNQRKTLTTFKKSSNLLLDHNASPASYMNDKNDSVNVNSFNPNSSNSSINNNKSLKNK